MSKTSSGGFAVTIDVRRKGKDEERRLVKVLGALPGVSTRRTGFIQGERDVSIVVNGRSIRLESKREEGAFATERKILRYVCNPKPFIVEYDGERPLLLTSGYVFMNQLLRHPTPDKLPIAVYKINRPVPKVLRKWMLNADILWQRNNHEPDDSAVVVLRSDDTITALTGAHDYYDVVRPEWKLQRRGNA